MTSSWAPGDKRYGLFREAKLPAEALTLLMTLKDTITPLWMSSFCVFTKPVTLSVMMSGKTMDLAFNVGWRCCDSKNLLVDGLPFQEGRFEITLPVDVDQHEHSYFYLARGWAKKRP